MLKMILLQITSWVDLLALPSYRFLKDRKDIEAKNWRKLLIDGSGARGKRALKEARQRDERRKRRARRKAKTAQPKDIAEENTDREDEKTPNEEPKPDEGKEATYVSEDGPKEENENGPKEESENDRVTDPKVEDEKAKNDVKAQKSPKKKRMKKTKEKEEEEEEKVETKEEEEARKKREAEKNAWRYAPPPYKFEEGVKRSALKGEGNCLFIYLHTE